VLLILDVDMMAHDDLSVIWPYFVGKSE
jgi:hypothetical protein